MNRRALFGMLCLSLAACGTKEPTLTTGTGGASGQGTGGRGTGGFGAGAGSAHAGAGVGSCGDERCVELAGVYAGCVVEPHSYGSVGLDVGDRAARHCSSRYRRVRRR